MGLQGNIRETLSVSVRRPMGPTDTHGTQGHPWDPGISMGPRETPMGPRDTHEALRAPPRP